MNTGIVARVDPSIVTGLAAGVILLTALTDSDAIKRIVQLVLQTGWLYLTNTRG